jgi:hypothetical protein
MAFGSDTEDKPGGAKDVMENFKKGKDGDKSAKKEPSKKEPASKKEPEEPKEEEHYEV